MKRTITLLLLLASASLFAQERQNLWPKGKMPDSQDHQIAAMVDVARQPGFKPQKNRDPYLNWYEAPAEPNGGCMILISGGSYQNLADVKLVETWHRELTKLGFQCVSLVYRTPRPKGIPIYQTAWEDGQRAVRLVRSQAAKRGYDPEKIGTISMSAGSHLAILLGANSMSQSYVPIDNIDTVSCHINWAIVNAPAYVTTDGEKGSRATREGYGPDVKLSQVFNFDAKTCPMSLHHGGKDPYSPNGSVLVYRKLHSIGVPAELHIYPNEGHKALGFDRAVEFMRQMGILPVLGPEEKVMERFTSDEDRDDSRYKKEFIWPEGKKPNQQDHMNEPYIEWHFPKELKTTAIQIVYSGGAYRRNSPENVEGGPTRRFFNSKGMTVVTLKYRSPRPTEDSGLEKYTCAWQDLQRAIRIVRKEAPSYGLDPDRIGIFGGSAGGHLTLMGATSSLHQSYLPIDDIDKVSCTVQWGLALYPAYGHFRTEDGKYWLVPDFSFDKATAPCIFMHGDSDYCLAINSVLAWEKMRAIGVQSEIHILALRTHVFQKSAAPGTGSYNYLDHMWDYMTRMGFNK